VELLLGVNKELFKAMELRAASWDFEQSIGDVFLMLGPHFKIYTSYCRNYETAMVFDPSSSLFCATFLTSTFISGNPSCMPYKSTVCPVSRGS